MLPTSDPDILGLRREFVGAALDGAVSQAFSCIRMLQMEADKPAIAAFERTLSFVRQAADEMKLIRAAQIDSVA